MRVVVQTLLRNNDKSCIERESVSSLIDSIGYIVAVIWKGIGGSEASSVFRATCDKCGELYWGSYQRTPLQKNWAFSSTNGSSQAS